MCIVDISPKVFWPVFLKASTIKKMDVQLQNVGLDFKESVFQGDHALGLYPITWIEDIYRMRHQILVPKTSRVVEQSRLSVALREAETFILLVKITKPAPGLHTTAKWRAVFWNNRYCSIGVLLQSALLFKNLNSEYDSFSFFFFKLNTA